MPNLPLNDLVVYHSGHFLRGKNARAHADRIETFLNQCTCESEVCELSIQVRTGSEYDSSKTSALIDEFTSKWGPAEALPEGFEDMGVQFPHSWTPDLTFDQLLDLVTARRNPRQAPLPMLSVGFKVRFQLKAPENAAPLPNQNWDYDAYLDDPYYQPHGFSEIWGDLGESSALGALISFPFAANDPGFGDYLAFFQRSFPARLSPRTSNWHWWIVRKDGAKHYRRSAVPAFGGTPALKALLAQASARCVTLRGNA